MSKSGTSPTGRVDPRRVHTIRDGAPSDGPVVYWMSRDQRVHDNWALLHARDIADQLDRPLVVLFALSPGFLGATLRQYDFMLRGLKEVEDDLQKLQIPFIKAHRNQIAIRRNKWLQSLMDEQHSVLIGKVADTLCLGPY